MCYDRIGKNERAVEEALRGKFGFTSFNMATVPGLHGAPGTFDVRLSGVDLSSFANNGSWKVKLAHKLGFLNPGNVRLSLRPAVDPVSKRVRVDIVSLSYGDGVKNFLANKFLSKVLDSVLSGKVNGAGVASGPDDSIASISIDPLQVLGKLAIKIPGETPEITTVALDQNGLSVGINF